LYALDVESAVRLIRKAFLKREEERQWQLYCSIFPHFDKKTFKTFEEFYKPPAEAVSKTPAEDILARAEALLRKAGGKHGTV
jgi:hypothetical protein